MVLLVFMLLQLRKYICRLDLVIHARLVGLAPAAIA